MVLVICYIRTSRGGEHVSLKELKMRAFPAQSGYRGMDPDLEQEPEAAPPQPSRNRSPSRSPMRPG